MVLILQNTLQRKQILAQKQSLHQNINKQKYVKKQSSFAIIPKHNNSYNNIIDMKQNNAKPKYIKKASSFAVIPKIEHKYKKQESFAVIPKIEQKYKNQSSFVILPNIEQQNNKINKIEQNAFIYEEKKEYKQYSEEDDYDINISDNWSSDENNNENINVNELIICYATHFKVIWCAGSNNNNLHSNAMIFEPILSENEYYCGNLALNNCGTDLETFKPAKCFRVFIIFMDKYRFLKLSTKWI